MKHDTTTLLHFLKTGELAHLKIGMSMDKALVYSGGIAAQEADDFDPEAGTGVLYDGCLQLVFRQYVLFSFAILVHRYPEYALPVYMDAAWVCRLKHMNNTRYQAFLRHHNLQQTVCVRALFYGLLAQSEEDVSRIATLQVLKTPF